MQIKNFLSDALSSSSSSAKKATTTNQSSTESGSVNVNYCEEVQPIIIRKTPKFLTRERQLAIRRRKPSSPDSQKSECLDMSVESDESISDDHECNE